MSAATLDGILARHPAIALAELDAAAALQTRIDRKYALPRAEAERVLARLAPTTRVLEIDGLRGAAYESVYFDTPGLLSYRMAATTRRRRFKLRTRSYVESHRAYLEMKTRGARRATVKERIDYDIRDRERLTPVGLDYADGALAELGLPAAEDLALRPTLTTRYRRSTLLLADGASRATVDDELTWLAGGRGLRRPGLVIVESKSAGRASELDRLLWAAGHRPVTLSKYGTGLAALDSDLPSTKWTRVLRRHFA